MLFLGVASEMVTLENCLYRQNWRIASVGNESRDIKQNQLGNKTCKQRIHSWGLEEAR